MWQENDVSVTAQHPLIRRRSACSPAAVQWRILLRKTSLRLPGKPSSIKVQRLVRPTCQGPPLKGERCTSKMELSLTISMTVIIRVKRSSKYSDICMVHREDGGGRPPPWLTAWPHDSRITAEKALVSSGIEFFKSLQRQSAPMFGKLYKNFS